MNPALHTAIMAVPSREGPARALRDRLVRQVGSRLAGISAPVIHWDTERQGPWWNARVCWELLSRLGGTHALLLQDDVLPCADLLAATLAAIEARPTDALSLYQPRKRVREAHDGGARWVEIRRDYLGGQAVVLPVPLVAEFLAWVDAAERDPAFLEHHGVHDDTRLGAWLKATRRSIYVTVPSLVQHIGHDLPGGSVMRHYGPRSRRMSPAFVGEHACAAGLDWTGETWPASASRPSRRA